MGKSLKQEIKEMLNLIVEETLKEVPGVLKIYLFGSYAYGEPNEDSDLDLMVVCKEEFEDMIQPITNIRLKTLWKVLDFDMFIYSREVFERRAKNYIMENKIYNEGVILYEA